MTWQYIFVQALGLVPSIVCFTSLQSTNRKKILVIQMCCGVLWAVHYGLLGAYAAVFTNIVGMGRAVICYKNDKGWAKSRWMLVGLIALYVAGSFLTWDGLYSLLPFLSMILTTFALWSHNMRTTRLLFLINSPPLFFYNVLAGSASCAIIEACAFVSFIIAIYRHDVRKKSTPDNSVLDNA